MTTGSITPVNAFTTSIPSMIDGQTALAADINGSIQALSNRSEFNKLNNDTQDATIASHTSTLSSHTSTLATHTSALSNVSTALTRIDREPLLTALYSVTPGAYTSGDLLPGSYPFEVGGSGGRSLNATVGSITDGDIDLSCGHASGGTVAYAWFANCTSSSTGLKIMNGAAEIGFCAANSAASGVFYVTANANASGHYYRTISINAAATGNIVANNAGVPHLSLVHLGLNGTL